MKPILILICVVIAAAAAIWFWKLDELAIVPVQPSKSDPMSAMSKDTPTEQPAPVVANEPKPVQAPAKDVKQATKSIADKNMILIQMSDKGGLIGKPIEVVERLVGPPTSVEERKVIYRLDTGLGGFEWKLEHANGIITSVIKTGLD